MAWIIGWDLVLEYAMASSTVAVGWSAYFTKFLALFKNPAGQALVTLPFWLTMDPFTAATEHTDYRAAVALQVASAEAVPLETAVSREVLRLPVDRASNIFRVESVKVQFTTESLARVEAELGEDAEASVERVTGALESALVYDPQAAPDEKLREIQEENHKG
jgi:hypothetical protein